MQYRKLEIFATERIFSICRRRRMFSSNFFFFWLAYLDIGIFRDEVAAECSSRIAGVFQSYFRCQAVLEFTWNFGTTILLHRAIKLGIKQS